MKPCRSSIAAVSAMVSFLFLSTSIFSQEHKADPLPSWNDGATKSAILDFVRTATDKGSPQFVPVEQRIATFDNDGTLWSEQPVVFQLAFAIDRVKALAAKHPEWKEKQPFKAVVEDDMKSVFASGERGLLELMMASHAGMTTVEFEAIVEDWLATAKHPKFKRPYTEVVYQPMLEVLSYLRANEFKTYIVSGGGIEFMRPWVGKVYGIPPEQVVGSSIKVKYEVRDGKPVLVRLPELDFNDDKAGKPVGIHRFIGRRPIMAFGNSDGDFEMLEWTTTGTGPRFGLIVHHTDADREWAYDRKSPIGRLERGLDEAEKRRWVIADMKRDWKVIYPFQRNSVTAIDILLEPDATMLQHATAANERLLKSFPKGFALDESHQPHVTCLQRYVRSADLDKVYEAIEKVLAEEKPTTWKLKAHKYYFIPFNDIGLAGIVIEPTDDLLRLQKKLIAAVAPFTENSGTAAAFVTTKEDPDINQPTIDYVSKFVPDSSDKKFNPHVTIGMASQDYLKKMLGEKFESFTFSPVGVSVYQLGNFGTARTKLKEWELKP